MLVLQRLASVSGHISGSARQGVTGPESAGWRESLIGENKGAGLTPGTLYIVATPIGNLLDITVRALMILESVDLIAAEDTRKTGMLLRAYGIKKPLISCYAHNEQTRSREIAETLKDGKTVAIVSDAGTPGLSDPGARVFRLLVEEDLKLSVIPGPSAIVAALAASGLDTESFAFGGFYPRQSKDKKAWLKKFDTFSGLIVFFESPKRLSRTMDELSEVWGERKCCVAREITKLYEEFIRGSVEEVAGRLRAADMVKGEIVVIVEGNPGGSGARDTTAGMPAELVEELLGLLLDSGMRKKEASQKLALFTGLSTKECYNMAIKKP